MRYKPAEPWAQPKPSRTVPEGLDLETATPTRAADLTADLLVPLGQAAVTGALLGALITFLAWELAPELDGETYQVEPRLVPSFKPYDSLREKVQGKSDERMTPKRRPPPLRWADDPYS